MGDKEIQEDRESGRREGGTETEDYRKRGREREIDRE